MEPYPDAGTALVTGASSGIGQAYARQLAGRGWHLVVVARRRDRLEELAVELGGAGRATVEVLVADLAGTAGRDAVEERLAGPDIGLLVNNAGFSGYMPFTELSLETADELIDVHVRAATRFTRVGLRAMLSRGSGAVINVASLLAFSESLAAERLPRRAVYAGCKAYLVTFTQLLHHELAGTGVRIQICCPGVVDTEFHPPGVRERLPFPPMSPDDVVSASLIGLERDDVVCIPGLEDASLFERYHEAQSRLLQLGNRAELAARYRN